MVRFDGNIQYKKRIKDLRIGESGFVVPWAYNPNTNELDQEFSVGERGGTVQLRVYCEDTNEFVVKLFSDYQY